VDPKPNPNGGKRERERRIGLLRGDEWWLLLSMVDRI
jgi:hypothetical protein